MINFSHRLYFRRLRTIGCLSRSVGFCSPDLRFQRSPFAGNQPCSMPFPLNGFGVRMSLLRSDLSHETRSESLQPLRQVSQLKTQYESRRRGSEKVTHIRSQPCSEHVCSFNELLLFLDPRRHNFLLLDDLVHEVFSRV